MLPIDRQWTQPRACPFCKSETISSTDRKVTEASYWRCEECGQLWNPGRVRIDPRTGMPVAMPIGRLPRGGR